MDENLIIGIASGVAGAIITYIFAVLKLRRELEFKYDTDLREKRIKKYLELWKLLEDLAKYARPKQLTVDDLNNLTSSLRQWYFEKGGLFLSDKSRDTYFDLQEAIKEVLAGYLFSWEEIPGNDNLRLIDYLKNKYSSEDWIKTAKIDKIDDRGTIRLTAVKNSLLLSLNNEKTEVKLQIDDGRTENFIAKTENRKLKIYQADQIPGTESEIDEPTYEMLREKGSALRTALTQDVGTRKAPKLN